MALVIVRELVHVVEVDDGWSRSLGGLESLPDRVNELAVRLRLAANERLSPAFLDKALGHQRFAHARHPVQKQAPRR